MSASQRTKTEVIYPHSDGKPMAESDLHRDCMVDTIARWRYHFAGQRVYVSGNLLIYYVEGDPRRCVAPDGFVVKDCDPRPRLVFKIWEEGRVPNFALETTSKKTWREDKNKKPKIYAVLRVPEYFLFDPLTEWLDTPLIGYRLIDSAYTRVEPDAEGGLASEQLGITFRAENGRLVMWETATGKRLLTEAEARTAEMRAAEAEAKARVAELRLAKAQAEIQVAQLGSAKAQAEIRIIELEDRVAAAEACLAQEAAARRALEEELARLRAERGRSGH